MDLVKIIEMENNTRNDRAAQWGVEPRNYGTHSEDSELTPDLDEIDWTSASDSKPRNDVSDVRPARYDPSLQDRPQVVE